MLHCHVSKIFLCFSSILFLEYLYISQIFLCFRTAAGQVKSVRRMPVARSVGQASKLTEMMDIEILRQEISIDDHKIPLNDLFNRLLTDPVTD